MKKLPAYFPAIFLFFMLLGVKDGRLALWTQEDPQPVRIFPVYAESLPPADQVLLRRGIRIDTCAQLQGLLEDYL